MKPRRSPRRVSLLAATLALACSTLTLPAQSTFVGGLEGDETNYHAPDNWTSGVPNNNSAGTYTISGTAYYNSGFGGPTAGDFTIGSGGIFEINGGSFYQQTGGAWMNIGTAGGSGTLNIINGVFSPGGDGVNPAAGRQFRLGWTGTGVVNVMGGTLDMSGALMGITANGTLNVSSGVMILSGSYENSGAVNLSGGIFNKTSVGAFVTGSNFSVSGNAELNLLTQELQPIGVFTMTGGTINTQLLAFQGSGTPLNLHGGRVNSNSAAENGLFSASATGYVNFTTGSTGELYLANSLVYEPHFSAGRIRLDDAIVSSSLFNISTVGSGTLITLVPEPSPLLAGMIGLGGLALLRRRKPARQA